MRILYSQLKEYIPQLTLSAREVGEIFTMIGFMMDEYKVITLDEKSDILLGIEVRQNRPDLMAIFGLVKELAAYLHLPYILPHNIIKDTNTAELPIIVSSNAVKRVMAVRMKNIVNTQSPKWLEEYLALFDMNSINLLVDISNYVMILTGIPNHIFDASLITGNLEWTFNNRFKSITTLNGTNLPLNDDCMIIQDASAPLALTMIGGENTRVTESTHEIIIEVAIYDRIVVQKNSRKFGLMTEAGKRLEKILDPNYIPYVLQSLIENILKFTNGEIDSKVYDFYLNREQPKPILFDPLSCEQYAGIKIEEGTCLQILKNLSFSVESQQGKYFITPPVNRLDIELKEDLIEEVIRMVGFYTIPFNEIPKIEVVKNITPIIIPVVDKIKDIIATLGYDEIISWPMTRTEFNKNQNYREWKEIITQNAVNEEVPALRQTLSTGLLQQMNLYLKNNVTHIKIFEIGKVFGKINESYKENESLGMLFLSDNLANALLEFKNDLETLIFSLGINDISFEESTKTINSANPFVKWDIHLHEFEAGILYKLKPNELKRSAYFAEINVEFLLQFINKIKGESIIELSQKLICFDTNLELPNEHEINKAIQLIKEKISKEYLWSIEIIDIYHLPEKVRYTIRITYYNLNDTKAKLYNEDIFKSLPFIIK